MSDIKERLSALYDGELDSNDIDSVIEELEADNNLQKTLSLYSLIGLSLADKNKVTDINNFKADKTKNIFANIWLTNSLTAAASIILTLFVVNYADFSRMNISVDSTNKIASAVSSREAKEIISNSDEYPHIFFCKSKTLCLILFEFKYKIISISFSVNLMLTPFLEKNLELRSRS